MKPPILGIDKVWLSTKDYSIREVNSRLFGIDTSTKEGHEEGQLPYLLTDERGREVRAWKLYHNGTRQSRSIGNYTVSDKGLLVAFNPSKIVHPYLLSEMGGKSYKQAISMIHSEMETLGIRADMDSMKMVRTDLARQTQMSLPCHQYEQAFRLLKGKRVKERAYEGGYLFANKSNQTMFYDKGQEMKHQKLDALMQGERNLMRAEVRILKAKSVADILLVNNFADFNQLAPSDLERSYKAYLTSRIFAKKDQSDQMLIDFNDEVEILRQYRHSISRNSWMQYLLDSGFDMVLMKFGSIEAFAQLCERAGYKRTQVWSIRQNLKQMLYRKAQFDKVRNEITPSTLIAELQERFAA